MESLSPQESLRRENPNNPGRHRYPSTLLPSSSASYIPPSTPPPRLYKYRPLLPASQWQPSAATPRSNLLSPRYDLLPRHHESTTGITNLDIQAHVFRRTAYRQLPLYIYPQFVSPSPQQPCPAPSLLPIPSTTRSSVTTLSTRRKMAPFSCTLVCPLREARFCRRCPAPLRYRKLTSPPFYRSPSGPRGHLSGTATRHYIP